MVEFKLLRKPRNEDDFDWFEGIAKELGVKRPHLIALLFRYSRIMIQRDALLDGLRGLIDSGEVPPAARSGRPRKVKDPSGDSGSP